MTLPLTALAAGLPASVPFVGPEAQERGLGRRFRARLGANESPFGPSPKAVAAMAAAAVTSWQYGDPENHDLTHALADHHGVAPERIVVGEGIDGLLQCLVRLLVEPGTPVVTSAGAYPTFSYHVNGFGGRLVTVPYRDDREDPEALLAAARTHDAKLIFLANPDNPMGTWHDEATIRATIDALPQDTVLCLDEAYADFAEPHVTPPIALQHDRLVRMRTFSKAYGLAGLRVGYAVAAPELASAFNKVRNHFGVNRLAQVGALAALADDAHLAAVTQAVKRAKRQIGEVAKAHGLEPLPSATNFVTLDTGSDGLFARELVVALADRGVFVRMPFMAPQNRCIRVSAGPPQMLDVFAEALGPALDAVRGRYARAAE